MKKLIFILTLLCSCLDAAALKPKWVNNTPKELNRTYKFVEIVSSGQTLNNARMDAKLLLAQDMQLANACEVSVESGLLTKTETVMDSRSEDMRMNESSEVYVKVSGQSYRLQAVKVDEYAEQHRGVIELHTLFMVAIADNPVFDRHYLTTSYGAAPVAMSVIPGLGQWYKGSKVKGICMFAAEAAAAVSIVVCDNQKASYLKKAKEQPKFQKQYISKADNWETARNISIGVAAGIWVYNIVDAAVAKGARRVKLRRADGTGLAVAPMVSPNGAGISFAYNF